MNKVRYSVLLAILAMLVVSLCARRVGGDGDEIRTMTARTVVGLLVEAARSYQARHHRPPTIEDLITADEHGRSELEEVPLDPWGKPYVLRQIRPGSDFEAVCSGIDGKLDTADDITSRSRR